MIRSSIAYLIFLAIVLLPSEIKAQTPLLKTKCKKAPSKGGTKTPSSKGTKAPHLLKTKLPTSKGTKAPHVHKTKLPTSKGTKSPSIHKRIPKGCDDGSPSAAPSFSPSFSPTDRPSNEPSSKPSISSMPTTSPLPTISLEPSGSPTRASSRWCSANIDDGEMVRVGNEVNGTYIYEMVYNNDGILNEMLDNLDKQIQLLVLNQLVLCHENRSRQLETNDQMPIVPEAIAQPSVNQNMRSLLIDSIDTLDADTPLSSRNECTNVAAASRGQTCQIFKGEYTLYVREPMNPSEARTLTLNLLKDNMNDNDNTLAGQVDGIEELHYLGDDQSNFGQNYGTDSLSRIDPKAEGNLSVIGGLLVGTGCVVTLLFIFAATRRREHYKVERMEEVFEEEESLFGKGIGLDELDNDTDLMSHDSWKENKNVKILGDDDSVYGLHGANGRSLRGNGLGSRDDAINVHKCTSATCPICTQHKMVDPQFIKSIYPDSDKMSNTNSRNYSAPDTIMI